MTTNVAANMGITTAQRDAIFRRDFLSFAKAGFAVLYPNEVLSHEWCLEAIAHVLVSTDGKKVRQIINAPPRSLKSFMVSVAWIAFKLGHEPTHKFICASYSQELANPLSAECRRLMRSDWYCKLFATRLAKSSEDELRTTAGGFRIAKSVGGTLTGLGGDTLIIDDPLNANDAESDTNRTSANVWFTRTLMSRLNRKAAGTIIVVMQRLHQDDLTGHLMEKDGWDLLLLPAIAPRDMVIPLGHRNFHWQAGESLQKREPLDVLDGYRRLVGAQTFSAHYLQEPIPAGGNMLRREWLRWCDLVPVRQPGDQIVQTWDTAQKVTANSDFSVGITFLVRNNNEYYLIDAFRKKLNFPDLCSAVENQARKHIPSAILIEEHASGTPLIDECKRKGMTNIIGRRPMTEKKTRMNGETPKLEAGSLILPRAAPWLDEFLLEYLAFPNGKHDDQIDALSQFLNWRTEAESKTILSWDFGCSNAPADTAYVAGLAAPSPEEMLGILRR